MVRHTKNEHINIFIVYILCAYSVVAISLVNLVLLYQKNKANQVLTKELSSISPGELFNKAAFDGVKVRARAYVVYDLINGEIISAKNENQVLPLASLTKVMTAVTATTHASKEMKITISSRGVEDGYDLGLRNGDVWTLSELLKYTLLFSSNDGARIIASNIGGLESFVTIMNEDAKALGLDLLFTDPTGLDINGKIGGLGSALTTAKLFAIARKEIPELLDATTKERQTVRSSAGKISGIPNTNQSVESLAGIEASKTGYTELAGGNLGIVVDVTLGHPVAIIVLGSSREGRFSDVAILYEILRKSVIK